ncbi:hypothetical protein HHI36_014713 [Cryptolaemus montrouzieri]|uniref:CCHC-type domain-containing protein n=1 Tax=Cryptolaemus montrouzieri TaxID=559131 RepID=A0ABD2N4L2_9CUCU
MFPVESGVRTVKLVMLKNVPSFVTNNGWRTLVTYRNQIKTCMICDEDTHMKKECPRKPTNRLNYIKNSAHTKGTTSVPNTYAGVTVTGYITEDTTEHNDTHNETEIQETQEELNKMEEDSDGNDCDGMENKDDVDYGSDGDVSSIENSPDIIQASQDNFKIPSVNYKSLNKERKRGRSKRGNISSEEERKVPKLKIKLKHGKNSDMEDEMVEKKGQEKNENSVSKQT